MKMKDIIVGRVSINEEGGSIFDEAGNHIADVRGWSRFQDSKFKASYLHDCLSRFIVDAINEKLGKGDSVVEEELFNYRKELSSEDDDICIRCYIGDEGDLVYVELVYIDPFTDKEVVWDNDAFIKDIHYKTLHDCFGEISGTYIPLYEALYHRLCNLVDEALKLEML